MKLSFVGADHEVTGSCHYIEACNKHILVDCGMEQGEDVYENQEVPVNASMIDYVFLTHAHIDHSGLIPLLYSKGFRGSVIATEPTCELCDIMLRDSAHIQMMEAEYRNRRGKRSGNQSTFPLYEMKDVLGVIKHFQGHPYNEIVPVCEGIQIRFTDAGHLLGSASIEVWIEESGAKRKIVFSGDIGNRDKPLLKAPKELEEADYVVMESTYGDRSHGPKQDFIGELTRILQDTLDRGGNLVIPAFAIGRTQEMLYYFRVIKEKKLLHGHDNFKVYMDSPLAIEATNIFNKNMGHYFSEEAMELARKGINPISFPGLRYAITGDESKLINEDDEPKVIISSSGMCEAGRIKHHLRHNLWREDSTILFVGYQANHTLGRAILEGAHEVKIFGELIEISAKIEHIEGFSGHADREGLIQWVTSFEKKPKRVFVVHGEDNVCETFAEMLNETYKIRATAPFSGASFDLIANEYLSEGVKARKVKEVGEKVQVGSVFARLLAAGQRLLTVISHNKGGANKDLAKFADQINSLCDKWDR